MATDVPIEAIRTLLSALSGIHVSRVYWSGEPEHAAIGPISGKVGKLTLNVTAREINGTEEPRYDFDEGEETFGVHRTLTISVRADDFLGFGEAYDLLEKVRMRLAFRSSRAAFRTAGLAYVDAPSITNLDYSVDNREVSSASLDIRLAQVVTEDVPEADVTTWIEKVSHEEPADIAAAPYVDLELTRIP